MVLLVLLAASLPVAPPSPVAGAPQARAIAPADRPGPESAPLAPDLANLQQRLADNSRRAIDAGVAELILSAIAVTSEAPAATAPRPDLRWRLHPLPPAPATGLAGQTAQTFGSDDGLALLWRHEIDGSATLSNALNVRHASGPVDAQLAVIGRLSVLQGGPMALSYRSSTNLAVLPFFTVGADAHGPLGTLSAIRPGIADSVIEPHMKFTLPLLGATAGATTGWRVPTGGATNADPDKRTEFHWKLTFQKKL